MMGRFMRITTLYLVAMLVLAGCALLKPKIEKEPFSLSLRVLSPTQPGEPVRLRLTLGNTRGHPIKLTLSSRPAHDLVVTRLDGTEVWRWSHNKIIQPISQSKWLSPGEGLDVATVWWKQVDNDGNPVLPGTYWVRGIFKLGSGQVLETKPETLVIKITSPLALRLEVPHEVTLWAFGEYVPLRMGQKVPLKLTLKNYSDQAVELTFNGRPAYDFIVGEIWRWSHGRVIQPILEQKTLQPSEELEFTAEWDQRDDQGRLVLPGTYGVQGVLYLTLQRLETEPVSLAIGPGLPLRLELEMPSSVRTDETVSLKLKVTNTSDRILELSTLSPPSDFIVITQDGSEIWRWARGKVFPLTLFPLTLQPGEVKEYRYIWDQMDNESYPVPAGTYWVQGLFSASQFGFDGVQELVLTELQKLVIMP